jgi:hypothetical protein
VRHRRGPNGGQGDGWCGIEADAEEERAHNMDPVEVREAVGEAPAVDPAVVGERHRPCRCVGGRGAGVWVAEKR